MILVSISGALILAYLAATLYLAYLVHRIPRRPVDDIPDWGHVLDTRIPAVDGGWLEVWRIEPQGPSKGLVVLAHGWGRNRGRMVFRARILGQMGFTTVVHSARDHGGSSPCRLMNAGKFAEDIQSVLDWLGAPAVLYGHSAGSVAAVVAAQRRPDQVKLLILEASYAYTRAALLSLYRWYNRFFGTFLAPMVLVWMDLFYPGGLDRLSPALLAPALRLPVLLIHGENDRRFPVAYAYQLQQCFAPGQADLFVAQGAGHSDSSQAAGYRPALQRFFERHWPAARNQRTGQ